MEDNFIFMIQKFFKLFSDDKEDEEPEKQSTPQILEKDSKNSWVKESNFFKHLF